MKPTVHILNGPNLNLLGIREPHLYGHTTLAQVQTRCETLAAELGLGCVFRQSNHEGVLVDWVQEARAAGAAVIINPAGLSFRSIPLLDQAALDAVRQWQFTPTLLNGVPVPVIMTVTVQFTLQ